MADGHTIEHKCNAYCFGPFPWEDGAMDADETMKRIGRRDQSLGMVAAEGIPIEHPSRRTTALPITGPHPGTVLVRDLRVLMKDFPRSALLRDVGALIKEYEDKMGKID